MRKSKITLGLVTLLLVCLVAVLCACSGVADGINGANGKDGQNGKSAYEIWLEEGHTGSQSDFLEWLKGADGSESDGSDGTDGKDGVDGKDGLSAYEIFMQQYPYYKGTEEQWIRALVNGELKIHTVTFKSEVSEDIVKYVVGGYALPEIPEVPEKEGQTSAEWNVKDFSEINQDMEVTAVYDMRKYVTFHNEFTDDEDITITVNYGEAITDIPTITEKVGNDSKWSVTDFSCVKTDLQVEAIYATQGLQYTLINQQTEYKVSSGSMSGETEELFILADYNGKPVTVIDAYAFKECDINFVYIPNSVTEIRDGAFWLCSMISKLYIDMSIISAGLIDSILSGHQITELLLGANVQKIVAEACKFNNITVAEENKYYNAINNCLIETASKTLLRAPIDITSITISNDGSVTGIGRWAFAYCSSLTSVTIPDAVTSIGEYAFYHCSSLANISIPNSVTTIESNTFTSSGLTSITIPNSVTSIGDSAFSDCKNLKSIVVPKSVISISEMFVSYCNNLEYIYYGGSKADLDKFIDSVRWNLYCPESAVIYFYSATKPENDGFYWHYDTDGVTPVIWSKEN